MSVLPVRPKRGLPPEEALERWSDPDLHAQMKSFSDASQSISVADGYPPTPQVLRHIEYASRRKTLEEALLERLREGTLLASVIEGSGRKILDPALWEVLVLDYYFMEALGGGRSYKNPELFEPAAIPLNVRTIPEWLDRELGSTGLSAFRHDPSYRHIWLNGIDYTLSNMHANIVAVLHKAYLGGDPWQHGSKVLEKAGSTQFKMADAFKSRADWRSLIESDKRGMYRLRLD